MASPRSHMRTSSRASSSRAAQAGSGRAGGRTAGAVCCICKTEANMPRPHKMSERSLPTAKEPEDDPLGRDVNTLGHLLGEVLREREGEDGFALVEEYRARTKALRAGDPRPADFGPEGKALLARTEALPLDQARLVVRAFTAYFHLVNIAEERHRLRVLDVREGEDPLVRESVAEAIGEAARSGAPADRVRGLLAELAVEPVFTAHPTEARRRTVLEKLRRLSELTGALGDDRLSPRKRARL